MTEEEKDLERAKSVYKALCAMLKEHDWDYGELDDGLTISCGTRRKDMSLKIIIEVDVKRQLVVLLSQMPYAVPESSRAAVAVAVGKANYDIVDGNFDYDVFGRQILYRMTSCYRDSVVGKEMLYYILTTACYNIDRYKDKFLTITQNNMSLDQAADYVK